MPITYPALYDAVYTTLRNELATLPMQRHRGRSQVYRVGSVSDAGRAGADRYRTVYQSSTNDAYRWTGPRPPTVAAGRPGAGGIYTAIGFNDALLGEFAHYAFGTTLDEDVQRKLSGNPTTLASRTFSPALAQKRVFVYAYSPAVPIADLSLSNPAVRDLLARLDRAPAVRAALQTARYQSTREAYLASSEHSVPRAMAQLVRDALPGVRALRVSSARAGAALQLHDEEADNLLFFGTDGMLVADLQPVREIWFERMPNGTWRDRTATL